MMDDERAFEALRILIWRSSTSEYIQIYKDKFDDDRDSKPPPAKRVRLSGEVNTIETKQSDQEIREYLPTPSVSTLPSQSAPMAHSPAKRRLDESLDERPSPDSTPRPKRAISTDDQDNFSVTSASSSKASKYSRNSSPTKQILRAELQPTGFRQSSFAFDPQPRSLQLLSRKLRTTYLGDGILPLSLQDEVRAAFYHALNFYLHVLVRCLRAAAVLLQRQAEQWSALA